MLVSGISKSNNSYVNPIQTDLLHAIDSNQTEQVLSILKKSDNIYQLLPNGQVPLFYAIRRGKLELVREMVKALALKPETKDSQGLTAVDHAMIGNDPQMIALILGHKIGIEFKTALDSELSQYNTRIEMENFAHLVQQLQLRFSAPLASELHEAARKGDLAAVQKHLYPKAPDPYDTFGMTPLHYAVATGKKEVVEWLIQKGGAKPDILTQYSLLSPLHLASFGGHVELLPSLIKQDKLNLNAQDQFGRTPLHYAMALEDLSTAKALIQNGADPFSVTKSGTSPSQTALYFAKTRSADRDPLTLTNAQCLIFIGIAASWANHMTGGQDHRLTLLSILSGIGSFLLTLDNFKSNPMASTIYKAAHLSWILGFLYHLRNDFGKGNPFDPYYLMRTQSGVNWNGESKPRALLGLHAGIQSVTCYQVAKSAIKGLSNCWKNRSLETLRPLRNALIHTVIGAHTLKETADYLSELNEQNKLLNAWDRYMDSEERDGYFDESFEWKDFTFTGPFERKNYHFAAFAYKYRYGQFNPGGSSGGHYSSDRSISPICNGKSEKECILEGNNEPKLSAIKCPAGQDSCLIGNRGIPKRAVRAKAAALLQLKEGYTDKDVKDSYKALAKKHAPDKVSCPNCTEEELEELKNQAQDLHVNLGLAYKLLLG